MRKRLWLTSLALGAALVTGGAAASAQAATTPIDASTTITAGRGMPLSLSRTEIPMIYPSLAQCRAAGEASGYLYSCTRNSSSSYWRLYLYTD
ncbi:hypothetical protein AB0E62_28250 [Streptomyces sp. NPDC038707]|uniref:hypothetical protein n=1 Tax=unclassified Streptomyces TaxID=2593676 RepID=UPI0033F01E54